MIDNFGVTNLFGRENYEYYARITGRVLKVDDDWIFSFRYPPDAMVSRKFTARIVYTLNDSSYPKHGNGFCQALLTLHAPS